MRTGRAGQEPEPKLFWLPAGIGGQREVINQKVWGKGQFAIRISKKKVKTACSGSERLGACGSLWCLLRSQAGKVW